MRNSTGARTYWLRTASLMQNLIAFLSSDEDWNSLSVSMTTWRTAGASFHSLYTPSTWQAGRAAALALGARGMRLTQEWTPSPDLVSKFEAKPAMIIYGHQSCMHVPLESGNRSRIYTVKSYNNLVRWSAHIYLAKKSKSQLLWPSLHFSLFLICGWIGLIGTCYLACLCAQCLQAETEIQTCSMAKMAKTLAAMQPGWIDWSHGMLCIMGIQCGTFCPGFAIIDIIWYHSHSLFKSSGIPIKCISLCCIICLSEQILFRGMCSWYHCIDIYHQPP